MNYLLLLALMVKWVCVCVCFWSVCIKMGKKNRYSKQIEKKKDITSICTFPNQFSRNWLHCWQSERLIFWMFDFYVKRLKQHTRKLSYSILNKKFWAKFSTHKHTPKLMKTNWSLVTITIFTNKLHFNMIIKSIQLCGKRKFCTSLLLLWFKLTHIHTESKCEREWDSSKLSHFKNETIQISRLDFID